MSRLIMNRSEKQQRHWNAFSSLIENVEAGMWFNCSDAGRAMNLKTTQASGMLEYWYSQGLLEKRKTGNGSYAVEYSIPVAQKSETPPVAAGKGKIIVTGTEETRAVKQAINNISDTQEDKPRIRFSLQGKKVKSLCVSLNEAAIKEMSDTERIDVLKCKNPKGLMIISSTTGLKLTGTKKNNNEIRIRHSATSPLWYGSIVGEIYVPTNVYIEAYPAEDENGRIGLFVHDASNIKTE